MAIASRDTGAAARRSSRRRAPPSPHCGRVDDRPNLPLDDDDPMLELQHEYIREAPARLAELRKDLAAFRAGEPDALESLRQRFHRLAGSGGSYGFQRVTDVARAMEHRILTPPAPTVREADTVRTGDPRPQGRLRHRGVDVGLPPVLGQDPGLRVAHAAGDDRVDRSAMRWCESLEEVGLRGRRSATGEVDPWDVPPSERPDLVVIGTDADDRSALAGALLVGGDQRSSARRGACRSDRPVRSAAHGGGRARCRLRLPTPCREGWRSTRAALAQIGAPPANVLVVEDDPAQSQLVATWLGQMNARVTTAASAQVARDALAHRDAGPGAARCRPARCRRLRARATDAAGSATRAGADRLPDRARFTRRPDGRVARRRRRLPRQAGRAEPPAAAGAHAHRARPPHPRTGAPRRPHRASSTTRR